MPLKVEYICGRNYIELTDKIHSEFMQRCLQLAELGASAVHPNPMVGAVIVCDGRIIGEGFHTAFGQPHAEVEAVRSVEDKTLLAKSTLYVNLEPCCHHGKTPPCTDLILNSGIPNVVICNRDPHEKVAGQGIKRLEERGVNVITGVLQEDGEYLNQSFFIYHRKKRPYIVLKWAQTADGFMGRRPGSQLSKQISNDLSARYTHRLRAMSDAILIGAQTAVHDNPVLTTRHWPGRNPLRVVLDPDGMVPETHRLFTDSHPTLVFGKKRELNAEFIPIKANGSLPEILDAMFDREISQLMIEGGANVLSQFIEAGLWDECHLIQSQVRWNHGVQAPKFPVTDVEQSIFLRGDRIDVYLNR